VSREGLGGAWLRSDVDSVCIHQDDLEERSRQVQQMHEIYRSAKRVVIWLGEAPADGQGLRAKRFMKQVFRQVEEHTLHSSPTVLQVYYAPSSVVEDWAQKFIHPKHREGWSSVFALLAAPW
jgi:hypothetical protein